MDVLYAARYWKETKQPANVGVLWNCLGGLHLMIHLSGQANIWLPYPCNLSFYASQFSREIPKSKQKQTMNSAFRSFPVSQRQATQLRCLNSQIHLRHGAFYGRQVRCWPRPGGQASGGRRSASQVKCEDMRNHIVNKFSWWTWAFYSGNMWECLPNDLTIDRWGMVGWTNGSPSLLDRSEVSWNSRNGQRIWSIYVRMIKNVSIDTWECRCVDATAVSRLVPGTLLCYLTALKINELGHLVVLKPSASDTPSVAASQHGWDSEVGAIFWRKNAGANSCLLVNLDYPAWWTATFCYGKIHHVIHGKIHYFYIFLWPFSNSKLLVHQRVSFAELKCDLCLSHPNFGRHTTRFCNIWSCHILNPMHRSVYIDTYMIWFDYWSW